MLVQIYSAVPFATPFPSIKAENLDWNMALNFLKDRQQLVKNDFDKKNIPYKAVVLAEKFNGACDYVTLRYKISYDKENRRVDDVYRADISAEKVPEALRKKIDGAEGEVDITDEIERELETHFIFQLQILSDWKEALNFFEAKRKQTAYMFKNVDTPNADIFTAEKNDKSSLVELKYKLYHKAKNNWLVETRTVNISLEKIPEALRKKIEDAADEVDITNEIESELAARENSAVAEE